MLSTLDQVLDRLDEAGEQVDGTEREDLLIDLHEVERHIRSAVRRLRRTVDGMDEPRTH